MTIPEMEPVSMRNKASRTTLRRAAQHKARGNVPIRNLTRVQK